MLKLLAAIAALTLAAAQILPTQLLQDDEPAEDFWAVLVAGSKGYINYRHQADICHAFQVIKGQGIPEENIIVMAYNDVAWHDENPIPGKLFNRQNGEDVYAGCNIDYHGEDVTKENFMAILTGDEAAVNLTNSNSTSKVLRSGPNSRVFVFFSDHGSPGHLLFPKQAFFADEFNSTIRQMFDTQMYREMFVFLEACESGSIFQNIDLEPLNVFAVTATNATAPSYGTYCYPHDTVGDASFMTCLGDLFSISWMEYIENNGPKLAEVSFAELFENVQKRASDKEQVQHFGNKTVAQNSIARSIFPGTNASASKEAPRSASSLGQDQAASSDPVSMYFKNYGIEQQKRRALSSSSDFSDVEAILTFMSESSDDYNFYEDEVLWSMVQSISSRQVEMYHIYTKSLHSSNKKLKIRMMKLLNEMMMVDETFSVFVDSSFHDIDHCRKLVDGQCQDEFVPKDFDCLRAMMGTYEEHCGSFTDYSRRFIKFLVRECEQPTMARSEALSKLEIACKSH